MYKGFERFWHWTQTTLISLLIFTGLEVRGTFSLFGFEGAVFIHNILAWLLVLLVCFAMFWHFTTGEWRQYLLTTHKLVAVMRYYGLGIFLGEHHPADKSVNNKLNPMQRLSYLGLKVLIIPMQLLSGLFYYFYNDFEAIGIFIGFNFSQYITLEWIAQVHTVCAYCIAMFIVIHVYLTTTGHTVMAHIKSMITGFEEVDDDHEEGHN